MKDRVSCEIRVGFSDIGREWVGDNRIDTNKEDRWGDLGESIASALRMAAECQELRVLAEAIVMYVMSKDDDERQFMEAESKDFMNAAITYLDCLNKEVERLNEQS